MHELATATRGRAVSPEVLPQPLTPHEFVDVIKRGARGESLPMELRERCGAFITAYIKPDSDNQSELKISVAERAAVRAQLYEELRANLKEILGSSVSSECSKEQRSLAREAKQIGAELFVALSKNLDPLSRYTQDGFAGLTARGEEAHHINQKDDVSALRLAFTFLETVCRQSAPDKISVGALNKGLKSAPFGSDLLAEFGSGFFQAHRNDLLHVRGDVERPLASSDIQHCITYLTSRASPAGAFAELADPIFNGRSIEEYTESRRGRFQKRISESEHSLITDDVLKRIEADKLPAELQEFNDKGLLDLSDPNDRAWARIIVPVEKVVPINTLCDFRVTKALEFVRESAEQAIKRAGITLKPGEEPLKVIFKRPEIFFGGSDDRAKGWGKVVKELLRIEKEGGYFASGRPDVMASMAAQEPLPLESKHDQSLDAAELQRKAMIEEADFVVSLCSILSHDLDTLSTPSTAKGKGADREVSVEELRAGIVRHLTSDVTTASAELLNFAQSMEQRFTDLADRVAPRWRETKPSDIAQESHALGELFKTKEVQESFKKIGVREEDMPQINGLVKALFFSIRTSWVHNSTARPTAGDVGHMLQAAQLLSDLTLIAEGKSVPPRADRSEWGVPDLAEAASVHSVVFNVMSRATVNQRSNQEVSGHLESLFERESMRAADRNADPESGKEKVDYYKKYAHELVRGLAALSGTSVLPDGHTTAGVLARGAMVSLWLRLGFGQKSEVDFPLWQAYCEPVARQD